jgi:hypothetical protein
MMNIYGFAAVALTLACGGALAQDEAQEIEMKVVVAAGDGDGSTRVHWVGENLDLDGMQIGETRTTTNESGETIAVTRTAEGMAFEVDGETVVLPDIGPHGEHLAFAEGIATGDVDIEILSDDGHVAGATAVDTHAVRAMPVDGITVISGETLDDSVRESIRSVLISAGIDEEVHFIDPSERDGTARIVTKKVEIVR